MWWAGLRYMAWGQLTPQGRHARGRRMCAYGGGAGGRGHLLVTLKLCPLLVSVSQLLLSRLQSRRGAFSRTASHFQLPMQDL